MVVHGAEMALRVAAIGSWASRTQTLGKITDSGEFDTDPSLANHPYEWFLRWRCY